MQRTARSIAKSDRRASGFTPEGCDLVLGTLSRTSGINPEARQSEARHWEALMLSSRRQFLKTITAAAPMPLLTQSVCADDPPRRPRVAMITTVCFFRSHAFNFLENFL